MYQSNSIRWKQTNRRGATAVESAFVLPVLLLLLFALLDLGLAVVRYNALADASRRIAREAIVHGTGQVNTSAAWGPAEFSGTAASSSLFVASVQNTLPTMTKADVSVRITWPDNDNSPRDRVKVELSYTHNPILPVMAVWGPITLRSTSTMHVVN